MPQPWRWAELPGLRGALSAALLLIPFSTRIPHSCSAGVNSSPHPYVSAEAQIYCHPRPCEMNLVCGDSELISSCLGAPDVLLGAPVAPEVPGTLGSLGQTVDTSPQPPKVAQLPH